MKLTNSNFIIRAMWPAIDVEAAHPTNSFPAVVIKSNGLLIFPDQLFVQDVEHLQERAIRGYAVQFIGDKFALRQGILLSPDLQF